MSQRQRKDHEIERGLWEKFILQRDVRFIGFFMRIIPQTSSRRLTLDYPYKGYVATNLTSIRPLLDIC